MRIKSEAVRFCRSASRRESSRQTAAIGRAWMRSYIKLLLRSFMEGVVIIFMKVWGYLMKQCCSRTFLLGVNNIQDGVFILFRGACVAVISSVLQPGVALLMPS